MVQTVATITLDVLTPSVRPITVHAKQFDNGTRYVRVQITNNGVPMTVGTDAKVYISGIRHDKNRRSYQGTVNEDGTLLLPLNVWFLQLVGSVECDVVIQDDDTLLTTMPFMLVVLESSLLTIDNDGDDEGLATPIFPQYDVASFEEVVSYLEDE